MGSTCFRNVYLEKNQTPIAELFMINREGLAGLRSGETGGNSIWGVKSRSQPSKNGVGSASKYWKGPEIMVLDIE